MENLYSIQKSYWHINSLWYAGQEEREKLES